jgi:ornithine decarboxylase
VKCNNLRCILQEIYKGGGGFDCASSDEIRAVQSVGARHADIIYANPCKSRSEIHTAKTFQTQRMTFDSIHEIEKITEEYPESKPILRIFVDDKGGARIPLNKKFGLHIDQLYNLLHREPRFHIYGLAFHVGSDCTSVSSYASAFETVHRFLSVLSEHPHVFTPEILDIGGGFSGNSKNNAFFKDKLTPFLSTQLKSLPFQTVMAEPGRFFAEECATLHVPVIGKKTLPNGENCITIDDSVYGIFSGVLFDGFQPDFQCITRVPYADMQQFTIFGRTCDSADKIAEKVWLPREINDSDVLEVKNIGAYSWVSSSEFNGFPKPSIHILS